MKFKIVHNPVLCLVREKSLRKILKDYPELKKYFPLASKKEINKWKKEIEALD